MPSPTACSRYEASLPPTRCAPAQRRLVGETAKRNNAGERADR